MNALRTEDSIQQEASSGNGILRNVRIAREEYVKFGLFGGMFFLIGFIYSFMRILKDMFVMKRQDASCFNFIKIFYILPVSFVVIILINYMLQSRSISKIFNISLIIFMGLFATYGTFIVFEEQLMFDSEPLKSKYEDSNAMVKNFMYTLLEPIATLIYITAELWGSVVLSYLFLSYLNESCTERQHGRFIPPLFILANVSLLMSAFTTTAMRKIKENVSDEQMKYFMGGLFFIESALTGIILLLKYVLETKIITTPIFIPQKKKQKKSKPKVSFKESLSIMIHSKFLMAMCGMVFFYNALYNLLETVYKFGIQAAAKARSEDVADYSARFNNYEQYITSIIVIILNLTSFSHLTDKKGWTYVAMLSPVISGIGVISVLGLGVYNSSVDDASFPFINNLVSGATPFLFLENLSGMIILSLMKVFKFTAFDVTKERISMRIEDRYRPKFKSIYDGIFNKLGKSGGSAYGLLINTLFADLNPRGASPLTMLISLLFLFMWMTSVFYLGANYDKSINDQTNIDIDLVGQTEEEEEDMHVADKVKEINV